MPAVGSVEFTHTIMAMVSDMLYVFKMYAMNRLK